MISVGFRQEGVVAALLLLHLGERGDVCMHKETYPGKLSLGDDIALSSDKVMPLRLVGAARGCRELETGCGCGGFLMRGGFSFGPIVRVFESAV